MKKFNFRLESVLRLRETQLNIQKNRLQQLLAECAKLERNLSSIAEERREAATWVGNLSVATSSDMRALSAFVLGSKSRESTLRQAIEGCEADIADQRGRTMIAERNRRLLLNLKSRKQMEWQKEFEKELEHTAQEAWQSLARS